MSERTTSLEDAERLATSVAPDFGDLLDGIRVARGNERWDLVETLCDMALASATGEVPRRGLAFVARQYAIALFQGVTEEGMPDQIRRVASSLEAREAVAELVPVVSELKEELIDLAMLLTDDSAASLVAAAARLRAFSRPDLAMVASDRAMRRSRDHRAALTVRAAALVDRDRLDEATLSIERAEQLDKTKYTANVLARIHTIRGDYPTAKAWAFEANRRDPEGNAGALSLMKIASLEKDFATAHAWSQRASAGRERSEEWIRVLAAREIAVGPHRESARSILSELWVNQGYGPARSALLELFGRAPARRGPSSTGATT